MDKDKRESIKKLNSIKPRNYWNTSGSAREFMRSKEDPDFTAIPTKDANGRITKEPENPWWIDSPEHGYCFWTWLKDKSFADGKMEPMQQGEIAKLFGCSATKIHFIIKEAIEKIKAKGLDSVLSDYASHEPKGEAIRPDVSKYDNESDD